MIGGSTLPDTNLDVSRLSFGTASLHHLYSSRARQALLQAALDIGITHFDTSPYYGHGLAEQELGIFQKRNRGAFTVATKVGLYPPGAQFPGTLTVWARKVIGKAFPAISMPVVNWSVSVAEKSLESSLRRLKTEYVDILFLHEPNPEVVNADEFLLWLEVQKSKGKLRNFGLAGHSTQIENWLKEKHPIAAVLQIKDSLNQHEADIVLKYNRNFQITYGYLSSGEDGSDSSAKSDMLVQALQRNQTGSVLFSTRRLERITMLLDKFQSELL
jgi:aryl-alcohol dehydrogenase-like predicted oxidoreductase